MTERPSVLMMEPTGQGTLKSHAFEVAANCKVVPLLDSGRTQLWPVSCRHSLTAAARRLSM
jgi:hypothetical protein